MSNAGQWPGMEKVCSNCAKRGTDPIIAGQPLPDSMCINPNSTRFGERVGYHGTGCDQFVYPHRAKREYLDTQRLA